MKDESYHTPKDVGRHDFALPGPQDTVGIGVDPSVVVVIERFSVEPGSRGEACAAATAHAEQRWLADDHFLGTVVLRGRDGAGVAVYSRWRADGRDPEAVPPGRSMRQALHRHDLVDSRTYSVEFTRQSDGGSGASAVSADGTPLAHFGLFAVEPGDQDELLRRAAEDAPKSLKIPGVVAINFHRSLDGRQVVNMGLWTGFEQFAKLLQQPGFADGDEYFRDLSAFEPQYFDVVAVRTSRVKRAT